MAATTAKTYSVDDLATIVAEDRKIDKARAAKYVRGQLRKVGFEELVKLDPNIGKYKSAANDGNRWPAVNGKVKDRILPKR